MYKEEIKMGRLDRQWQEGLAKSITLCITEDCNLRCKYCYMTGKNSRNKMSIDVAKKTVDFFLNNPSDFKEPSVVWDFIGGEPFIETDLIDEICDYIKYKMYTMNHPWFNSYRFSFSTNGLTYGTEKVQKYINKNRNHVSIGISVDGNKIKHDLQRVKIDGSGSYDDVVKNVPLWLEQFPFASTKATFSHDDIPHLKDSIISLWNLGIKTVAANVVFEDVWHDGDDLIFEEQLRSLADYILEKEIWWDYSVRFFEPTLGFPLNNEDIDKNWCGTGKMIAVDTYGNLFPCIRFCDFTLSNKAGYKVGDIYNGIDYNKLRPFKALTLRTISNEECINCNVARGCAWCAGCNYDYSENDTLFERMTFICKMHKANVRANEYFWNEFSKKTSTISPRQEYLNSIDRSNHTSRYLNIITSDTITPHCSYRNWRNTRNVMQEEILEKGMQFAKENDFIPVIIGDVDKHLLSDTTEYLEINSNCKGAYYSINVYDNQISDQPCLENNILLVNRSNLSKINELAKKAYNQSSRINLILEDINAWTDFDITTYDEQLNKLVNLITELYQEKKIVEMNILTDIFYLKEVCDCGAGRTSFSLAPNGKIYVCPAFYFNDENSFVGTIEHGIDNKKLSMLNYDKAFGCKNCDAYHCKRCVFYNKTLTNEYNIPSKIQCIISQTEKKYAYKLQQELIKNNSFSSKNFISNNQVFDPIDKVTNHIYQDINNYDDCEI